jgi:hypothetical protein
MKKTIIAVLASSALVLAACGSDSDSGSNSDSDGGFQSQLVTMLTEQLDKAGIDYDAECIEDKAGQISDEDAEAIVAAGVDGDPEVSEEADEIGDSLLDCVELETEPTTT